MGVAGRVPPVGGYGGVAKSVSLNRTLPDCISEDECFDVIGDDELEDRDISPDQFGLRIPHCTGLDVVQSKLNSVMQTNKTISLTMFGGGHCVEIPCSLTQMLPVDPISDDASGGGI